MYFLDQTRNPSCLLGGTGELPIGEPYQLESYLEVMEDKGNTMHLSFQTAWSPPRGVIEKMVEQGFSTEFWYMEQGNDFWGYEVDGKEIHYASPSDYFVDAWGNTYSERMVRCSRRYGEERNLRNPLKGRINFETDETETTFYDTWEIEWTGRRG